MLRGVTVPDWIVDGLHYCEESPVLELDTFMVRIANLRAKSLHVLSERDDEGSLHPHQLKIVAGEADELNLALELWSRSISESWQYSIHHSPPTPQSSDALEKDQLFEGISHTYPSPAHAAIWNRYRAIRLIVNSICTRSLSELLVVADRLPHCDARSADRLKLVQVQQSKCRENIESLATEICGSLPCFFSSGLGLPSTPAAFILPKMAVLMVWPVAVAIRTQGIPDPQRIWLKGKLKTAADALGDTMLETVIRNDEFNF
jgi:hypothetical protein